MSTNLWVVVPALNEAENLVVVVPRILTELHLLDVKGHVLVVDDGSTDKTREVVDDLADRHTEVRLVSLGRNMGKATALRRGFEEALLEGAEVVVMMDADGQDDPAELPLLLARLDDGADLVTGARTGAPRPVREAEHLEALQHRDRPPLRRARQGLQLRLQGDARRGGPQRLADAVRRAAPLPHRRGALAGLPGRRGAACSTTSGCTARRSTAWPASGAASSTCSRCGS